MRLLDELQKWVSGMGTLRRAWFTSFNTDIEFVETYILPVTLGANTPRSRLEYEQLQLELTREGIDFRVFCDPRFLETNRIKRTSVPVHGIRPERAPDWFSERSLFHAKVIYLEDRDGMRVIGAGSANLTLSGWARNLEVFQFFEVTTHANYREICQFFEQLCIAAGIRDRLADRRNFTRKSESWRFVHSYQNEPFPEQLLSGVRDTDLAVWSPYLPRDLANFIERLEVASGAEELHVHLVADRVEGKHLRTEWNNELPQMKVDGRLAFYDYPVGRHPNTELCHAKLWKLPDRLAIGSWNFTGPGSNCLRDDKGNWSRDNNVEAGFIIDDDHNWRDVCGKPIDVKEEDCSSPAALDEDALVVSSLPPFDLHVSFDWHTLAYDFDGVWLGTGQRDGYSVLLPGVTDVVPLMWNARHAPTSPDRLLVDDGVLLRDRVYRVVHGGAEIQRGLVCELNAKSRRVQSFETLQDLLEALVQGDDAQSLPDLAFRIPLDRDTFPDESFDPTAGGDPPWGDKSTYEGISYFRLFQSTSTYHRKLMTLEKLEELDSQVFTWPGCLLELVNKTRAELQRPSREVFNWFLVNEVSALCKFAHTRRRALARGAKTREPAYKAVPEARWKELDLELPVLPAGVRYEYSALIKNQCNYG